MQDTKYNGWTNYATWRVNLEIFDGCSWIEDFEGDTYDLSQYLKEVAQSYIEEQGSGLAYDYAMAFLDEVNWYEIAKSMKDAEAENDAIMAKEA